MALRKGKRGAAVLKDFEGPPPDGQTSKDPVKRVAPGTLGAGLNPFFLGSECPSRAYLLMQALGQYSPLGL